MADEAKPTDNQESGASGNASDRAADAARGAAEAMRGGAEKARDAFNDHVMEPAKRAGEALKASGQKIAENGSAFGTKLIDQAEANAREAFQAMRAAAGAKDVSEVMRIQSEYLREQGQRSMAQAREVSELIMQFGRDAVGTMRGHSGDGAGGQPGDQNRS